MIARINRPLRQAKSGIAFSCLPIPPQAHSSLVTCLGQCDWCGIEPHAVANLLTRMPLSGELSSHASTTRRLLLYQRLSS